MRKRIPSTLTILENVVLITIFFFFAVNCKLSNMIYIQWTVKITIVICDGCYVLRDMPLLKPKFEIS